MSWSLLDKKSLEKFIHLLYNFYGCQKISCTYISKPAQTDWYTKITLVFLVKDTEGALAVRKAKYAASNSNSYHCANKKLNNILLPCGAN